LVKNKAKRISFVKSELDAKRYYKTWMKEVTKCPLFEKPVRISKKGWDHIYSGSRSRKRNIKDKHRKFLLLKAAKKLIKEARQVTVEKKNGTKYFILEEKVLIQNKSQKVKVLLKEDKKGNKYFFSVM
jgi:hypothetical protein